jgi:hypothetical protein
VSKVKFIFSIVILLACSYSLAGTLAQVEIDLNLIDENLKYITSDFHKKKAVMDLLQSTEKEVEALLESHKIKYQLRERIAAIYEKHPLIDPSKKCPNIIEIRDGKGFRSTEQVQCTISTFIDHINHVYRTALKRNGPIEGKIIFDLMINPNGKSEVSIVSSEFPDNVAQKFRSELSKIEYPNAVGFAEIWNEQYTMSFYP